MTNVEQFDVFIEIPAGSRNKYEFDFDLKMMRFDRLLFSSMKYPADYGFIPETLALDNDPLDVLVLTTEPTIPGLVMEVKPIGVFRSEEHTSELQSRPHLVCRLLLEKKKKKSKIYILDKQV